MLSGSPFHANDIKPTIANEKPKKARKTEREKQRAKSSVGGCPWKGPTWIKRGLVDQMIWPPENSDWILTRPRVGAVLCKPPGYEVGLPVFSGSFE